MTPDTEARRRARQNYRNKRKALGLPGDDPQREHRYRIAKKFGLSPEDYQRMLVEQNGVCAICRQPETARRYGKVKNLAVDHCHATKAIRGLLCSRCNTAIGSLKDNPATARAAADYLERAST